MLIGQFKSTLRESCCRHELILLIELDIKITTDVLNIDHRRISKALRNGFFSGLDLDSKFLFTKNRATDAYVLRIWAKLVLESQFCGDLVSLFVANIAPFFKKFIAENRWNVLNVTFKS